MSLFIRFLAIKITIGILLFSGCVNPPRKAPTFTAPSTTPIKQSIAAATGKAQSAQKKLSIVYNDCPAARAEINAVSADLLGVINELRTSEGDRVTLQSELERETKKGNKLANDYNTLSAKLDKARIQHAKDTKTVWWYRLHWWGSWIVFGLGVLVCIGFAILRYTGRIAIVAAKVGL